MNSKEKKQIDWHTGFAGFLEICLHDYEDVIEIEKEHHLTVEPPKIDFIIIKKDADVVIDNAFGRIFKCWNILEYKNPNDSLNIDVLWKCIGYAGLYKAYGKSVNAIPQEELTISIFRHRHPSKLMMQLKESGYVIENPFPGIYYIKGLVDIPVQIVVSKELDDEAFAALKVMAKQSDTTDIVEFISQARVLTEPRLRQAADNIFQISASINKKLFNELRKEDAMCQALREIMAPEIEESYNEGRIEGRIEGITEGRAEGRVALIKDMLRLGSTAQDISKLSGVPLEFILEIEKSMSDAE